jgi:deoxyribonuclease-4
MPYLPNLAAPTDDVYKRSVASLIEELRRSDALHIPYLVTHLGSLADMVKQEVFRG